MSTPDALGASRPGGVIEVVEQHAGEAAFLWLRRETAISEPHYTLDDLVALDDHVEAHIDGLRLAGETGWAIAKEALSVQEAGEFFAASVLALESDDPKRLTEVLQACETSEAFRGISSALGWVSAEHASRWIPGMLAARSPAYRRLGTTGIAIRREDPGQMLRALTDDADAATRVRAIRAVGELKRSDLADRLRASLQSGESMERIWAAWSAVLLGERAPVDVLARYVERIARMTWQHPILQVAVRAMEAEAARNWIRRIAAEEHALRTAVIACGISGDPFYVPWLIKNMRRPPCARVAGEAFSHITGLDLAQEDLEAEAPEEFQVGPTESPADEDVDVDPDGNLPWPDPALIERWWERNKNAFRFGVRYLCGRPISDDNCRKVLAAGYQRQRIGASYELALMNRTEPLFEWRAHGLRQRAWLRRTAAGS